MKMDFGGATQLIIPLLKKPIVELLLVARKWLGLCSIGRVLTEIPGNEKHQKDFINDFLAMSMHSGNASGQTDYGM
jgi:hypothetical protein